MPFVRATSTDSTDLFYQDCNPSGGHTVVLIHGWPMSWRMWEPQIGPLVEEGYRVVAYDRRGFGMSGFPWDGYDYDTFASDLNDVLTQLDLRNVTLVGFSMGGGEVARYFGNHGGERAAKAVLLAAVTPFLLKTDDNPNGVPGDVFDGMKQGLREDRIAFLHEFSENFFNWGMLNHPFSDQQLNYLRSVAAMAQPNATIKCVDAFGTTDFRDDLRKMTDVPTMIVHGDADNIVPIDVSGRVAAQMLPHARFEVIDGAPHGLNATHTSRVNELLLDFLRH